MWLGCAVDPRPEAMQRLLRAIVGYLAAPGCAEMISEAGFAELVVTPAARPHPGTAGAHAHAELMAAIGLVGSEAAIAARLQEYRRRRCRRGLPGAGHCGRPAGIQTLTAMAAGLAG